ncbi:MAG TPA: hypothetical protein VGL81_30970 [Polyangiaceae bacterium]|jgi:hypothetical protein
MVIPGKRLLTVAWLALTMAAPSSARAQPPPPTPRTEEELAAARKLFAQALHDEEDGRYEVALARFREVEVVRDTAPVEYRIGMCLEALGRLADALAAYEAAVRIGGTTPAESDVTAESHERASKLSKRVGHLTLSLSARAPGDAEVRVDGRAVSAMASIPVDPGPHRIEATAPGVAPFRSDVTVPEGGSAALTVSLDPPLQVIQLEPTAEGVARERHDPGQDGARTWGWFAVGAGSALLVASGVSLFEREADIRRALRLCPGGACVGSIDPDAQSATDRARVEGPLALGLGIGGVIAAGVGVYLVVRSPSSTWIVAPTAGRAGAGLSWLGAL